MSLKRKRQKIRLFNWHSVHGFVYLNKEEKEVDKPSIAGGDINSLSKELSALKSALSSLQTDMQKKEEEKKLAEDLFDKRITDILKKSDSVRSGKFNIADQVEQLVTQTDTLKKQQTVMQADYKTMKARLEENEAMLKALRFAQDESLSDENPLDDEEKYADILSSLSGKKLLFVGFSATNGIQTELKAHFPNSVYVDADNSAIPSDVDCVVYLIAYMSHGLFYKIRESSRLNGVKRVYCNSRSLAHILNDIASQMEDEVALQSIFDDEFDEIFNS